MKLFLGRFVCHPFYGKRQFDVNFQSVDPQSCSLAVLSVDFRVEGRFRVVDTFEGRYNIYIIAIEVKIKIFFIRNTIYNKAP